MIKPTSTSSKPTSTSSKPRLVAFLRGLNVGGHRVKMDKLKAIFEAAGHTGVSTYIASGNVIFDDVGAESPRARPALEPELEAALRDALGYAVATFIRPLGAVATLAAPDWLEDVTADGFNVHIIFLKNAPDAAVLDGLAGLQSDDDQFRAVGDQVYWLRRGGLSDSPIKAHHLDKALQRWPNTIRTIKTAARIAKKFGQM